MFSGGEDTSKVQSSETQVRQNQPVANKTKRVGRKRVREPEKHISAVRKKLRNSGQEYINVAKKVVLKKQFTNVNCNCRNKCHDKISEESRRNAFLNFWKMGNFSTQNAFLCGIIKQHQPKIHRPRSGVKGARASIYIYFINTAELSHQVCKQYFIDTYRISNGRLMRALKRGRLSSPGEDLRGKHPPGNKTPDEKIERVKIHIQSFPAYQSHYTREHNPNRKYLDTNLNIRTMYSLYKEKCDEENTSPVSEAMYRKIFHRDFNLHFHVPLKDTCVKCDTFKAKLSVETDDQKKQELNIQHDLHLRKAQKARESLQADKAYNILNKGNVYAFTFDLEKALSFPTLTCSIAYYKRKMYVYNFGIHLLNEEETAFMYVWNETTASRGAQEMGSCIRKHLISHAGGAKHIIAFSDACGGQNRNFKQCLLWLKLLADNQLNLETIDHKFMVSGHSFLPNDRDFGMVEQYAKNRVKFVPEDWYSIIKKCKAKKPFDVNVMDRTDFFSTSLLEKSVTRRKTNTNNEQISWLKIQWLHFDKKHPYKIFYKETLNEDIKFKEINLTPNKKKGRLMDFKNIDLPFLYESSLPVTASKKKNMEELFQFIPPVCQNFFRSLKVVRENSNTFEDIGPLEDYLPENDE